MVLRSRLNGLAGFNWIKIERGKHLTPVKYTSLLIGMPQLNNSNNEVSRGKNFTRQAG